MEKYKGKKLLILGGASLHKKFVETAHEYGIITVVTDNVKNSPAKAISDISYDINVTDIDELIKMCKKEKVDAVISGYLDFCQRYYQELCEKLNLPCYGTYEQFKVLTNKSLFKKACIDAGIDIVPTYTEESILSENKNDIEYPIYVKPSYSRGSRAQKICYNSDEAKNAIDDAKKNSTDNTAIIEKYMGAKDIIEVCYIVINGEPHLIRTSDLYNGRKETGMDHICIAEISPSKYTNMYINYVDDNVKNFIKKLNIKNAPFFMQGFVDGEKVRFFDPGLRFPGTEFSRLQKKITGIDTPKALIEFAFSGKINSIKDYLSDDQVYLNNNFTLNLFPVIKKGKIKSITDINEILKIDGVEYASYRRKEGDEMEFTGDVNQRIAEINIRATSISKIKNIIENIYKIFKVKDSNDNDMIFSKFDVNLLEK